MQFAALAVAVLALGLAAYAVRRTIASERAVNDMDRASYDLGRYVIDHMPAPTKRTFELVEADVGHLTEN